MKIGFLPLYIKLYDDVSPEQRPARQQFADRIAGEMKARGFDVIQAPICRIEEEFAAAVRSFEEGGAQAILTLHLAYSPSLESAAVLANTELPLVICDTTPDYEFDFEYGDKVSPNHGIHGVQDLCNLMLRHEKPFLIAAGHYENSDLLQRVAELLRSAGMAYQMSHCRVGAVGGNFKGMGDFLVPEGTFGMQVIPYQAGDGPSAEDVAAEASADFENFVIGEMTPEAHQNTTAASLRLRRWVEQEKLDAFTVCFPGITRANGWDTVPFLEGSKAMARGVGYAGEGDVLTAALVASLLKGFPESTFSEMFCPDWKGNRIYVSHMGEVNLNLTDAKPLLSEMNYSFSDTGNPVIATGCLKAGKAYLVNLAPGANGKFTLIVSAVEFFSPCAPSGSRIEGWFRPACGDIAAFLEEYSRLGGTHHLAVSYGATGKSLRDFAHLMKWDFREI